MRVIGSDGKQLGVFSRDGAIKMARDEGLDLVEINPNSNPPVCKIIDYGKFKYLQQKKKNESRKHQSVIHVKEIKMRPNIDEHDILFKLKHVRRFLQDKDKAKITIQFRGREMQHLDRGRQIADRIVKDLADVSVIDMPPRVEGRNLSLILAPK